MGRGNSTLEELYAALHCGVQDMSKVRSAALDGDPWIYSLPFVSCSSRAPISNSDGGLWPPQHEHWPA